MGADPPVVAALQKGNALGQQLIRRATLLLLMGVPGFFGNFNQIAQFSGASRSIPWLKVRIAVISEVGTQLSYCRW